MEHHWFLLFSLHVLLCVFSRYSNDYSFYYFYSSYTFPRYYWLCWLVNTFFLSISFSRLPFPCTLQCSSRCVGRIKLSFVDFITVLLSSYWCSLFYSFKCIFSFLRHIGLLKLLFGHLDISWGLNYLSTIHETHIYFLSYPPSNKRV